MLRLRRDERGAAPVEVTFTIVLLMILTLGVVQVAFALYARNVVMSSAHEGARAAAERGRSAGEAEDIAREVITRATGRLIKDLDVSVGSRTVGNDRVVIVHIGGVITDFGPIPLPIPLDATASAHLDEGTRR